MKMGCRLHSFLYSLPSVCRPLKMLRNNIGSICRFAYRVYNRYVVSEQVKSSYFVKSRLDKNAIVGLKVGFFVGNRV